MTYDRALVYGQTVTVTYDAKGSVVVKNSFVSPRYQRQSGTRYQPGQNPYSSKLPIRPYHKTNLSDDRAGRGRQRDDGARRKYQTHQQPAYLPKAAAIWSDNKRTWFDNGAGGGRQREDGAVPVRPFRQRDGRNGRGGQESAPRTYRKDQPDQRRPGDRHQPGHTRHEHQPDHVPKRPTFGPYRDRKPLDNNAGSGWQRENGAIQVPPSRPHQKDGWRGRPPDKHRDQSQPYPPKAKVLARPRPPPDQATSRPQPDQRKTRDPLDPERNKLRRPWAKPSRPNPQLPPPKPDPGGKRRHDLTARPPNRDVGGQRDLNDPTRQYLIATAKETMAITGKLLQYRPGLSIAKNIKLDQQAYLSPKKRRSYPTKITVENNDSLAVGRRLTKEGFRVAVLNLANADTRGGGFRRGREAQEEHLCYCSTLYSSLSSARYPLDKVVPEVVYSPHVAVIREPINQGGRLLLKNQTKVPENQMLSVVSVAAIRDPARSGPPGHQRFTRPENRIYTKRLMAHACRTAYANGNTALVLGALGCGVFKNPVEDVAKCWREVLQETPDLMGYADRIVFAVLSSSTNRNSNFDIFRRVLDGQNVI